MSDTVIHLNDIPEAGDDLEFYVAALFQICGYFVEKGIIERNPDEVLELDIVATDYKENSLETHLIEVKGGKWGYSDAFKVIGWMQYLNIQSGAIFTRISSKDITLMQARLSALGLRIVDLGDCTNSKQRFYEAGFGSPADDALLETWRYSASVERKLARTIVSQAKSTERVGAREALEYQHLVNNGVFFSKSDMESLASLYQAFQRHPVLSRSSALEIQSGIFDPEARESSTALNASLREGKHELIQATLYLEHRARLAILRAGVNIAQQIVHEMGGDIDWFIGENASELPKSFIAGLRWLHQQPTFQRYAVFWQNFLWGWGGFYLNDRADEEFTWMSSYSGVPQSEIPNALKSFDHFFPITNGWITQIGNSCARQVKLLPPAFKGIGANHRLQKYERDEYSELSLPGYTESDLLSWNNIAVNLLRSA